MAVETTVPAVWLASVVLGVLKSILGGCLLHKECKKRRSGESVFTTKYLSIFSIICILCPVLVGLNESLSRFIPFCYFAGGMWNILNVASPISMGYYQISRLYYCFSNSQIHSDKGYSKCLFIFMYSWGIIFFISSMMYEPLRGWPIDCGIDDNWVFYRIKAKEWVPTNARYLWTFISYLSHLSWDILTLILYRKKVSEIHKHMKSKQSESHNPNKEHNDNEKISNEQVTKRIISVLYRISVLTIWYNWVIFLLYTFLMFVAVVGNAESIFSQVLGLTMLTMNPLIYAPAMYLIMDHNKADYYKFIKCIYHSRLYWCVCCCECFPCCKCRSMIKQQYEEIVMEQVEKQIDLSVGPPKTQDLTLKAKHSQVSEITIPTKSVDTANTNTPTIGLEGIDEHHEMQHVQSGMGIRVSVEASNLPKSGKYVNGTPTYEESTYL